MAKRELEILLKLRDEASKSLQTVTTKIQSLEPNLKKVAIVSGAAFGALTAGIIKTTSDFSAFDTQIQKAGANIDATSEQLEDFRKAAMKVGLETRFSATEAAEALYYLAGGSIDAAKAQAGLAEAVKIAATGELSLNDAVLATSDALTQFNLGTEDATKISDLFIYSTTRVQQNMTELTQAFKQVASTARQAGLSMEETTGFLNVFADSGKRGMEGGIALANILRNLTTNVVPEYETEVKDLTGKKQKLAEQISKTEVQLAKIQNRMDTASKKSLPNLKLQYQETQNKLAKLKGELSGTADSVTKVNAKMSDKAQLLQQLGVQIFDSTGKIRNMNDVILELIDKFQGMTDAQKFSNAETIFGARAARDWLTLIGQGSDVIREYQADLMDAAGVADEFNRRLNEARSPMEVLGSLAEHLSLTIGKSLTPRFQELASSLQPIIERVAKFIDQHPKLVSNMILATTALTGLIFAITSLGIFIISTKALITTLSVVLGALSLPMLAIIGLIGVIVATGIWWVKNWQENKETIKWVWEEIKNAFKSAVDWIKAHTIDPLVKAIESVISAATRARDAVRNIGSGVVSAAKSVINTIPGVNVKDAVITPGGQVIHTDPADWLFATKKPQNLMGGGGMNITITGNTFMSDRDAAEKIGDMIMKTLKLNYKLT
jgi:TP901 family phage tail tape measure protein